MESIRVKTVFSENAYPYLYDSPHEYSVNTLPTFIKDIQLPLSTHLTALLSELPDGAFVAGDVIVNSCNNNSPASYFVVHFDGEESFLKTVKRIQNAPLDSYLHGYSSSQGLKSFLESSSTHITFKHTSKPEIRLARLRWFGDKNEVLNTIDVVSHQTVFDTNFTVSHHNDICRIVRNREIVLSRSAMFNTTNGGIIQELMGRGWRWRSDYWSSNDRDYFVRRWRNFAAANPSSDGMFVK